MQDSDKQAFTVEVQSLAAAFGKEPTAPMFAAYWWGLRDVPVEAFQAACRRAMQSCKFMPVPAELRELTGEVSPAAQAIHAWQSVKRAIAAHGSYASVNFLDPAVNAAIRSLGGWARVCSTEPEELDKWTRKDFERLYAAFTTSGVNQDEGGYLPGLHESANAGKGYGEEKVIQIGSAAVRALPATGRKAIKGKVNE